MIKNTKFLREWFDLTDKSGSFGVSVWKIARFGPINRWQDPPADIALHPGGQCLYRSNPPRTGEVMKWSMDFTSHKGDWRTGKSNGRDVALNQPHEQHSSVSITSGFEEKLFISENQQPEVDVRAIKENPKTGTSSLSVSGIVWYRG